MNVHPVEGAREQSKRCAMDIAVPGWRCNALTCHSLCRDYDDPKSRRNNQACCSICGVVVKLAGQSARLSAALDQRPYRDEHDKDLLRRI